ncbi:hypothetical protein ACF0H5_002023 [Mactra antiquata]
MEILINTRALIKTTLKMEALIVTCQVLSTVLSIVELFCSEYQYHTAMFRSSDMFHDSGGVILTGMGVIGTYKKICLTVKYLGAFAHLFASFYMIKFIMKGGKWNSVQKLVANGAVFFTFQLLGVVALVIRLVVLLLYNISTVCSKEETQTFEQYHVTLGFAAGFGVISLFTYLFYVYRHMYNRLISFEEQVESVRTVPPQTQVEQLGSVRTVPPKSHV